MKSARETALIILYRYDKENAYLNIAFNNMVSDAGLSREDVAFIKELVFGTVKYKITLDYIISSFSKLKLKKISPYILNILRMSTYQMLFMDKVPKSAAVNEGVKLAKKYGHSAAASFSNAVLRKISELDELNLPNSNSASDLSVLYSHPEPLVQFLINSFGLEKAKEILSANMSAPPVCIRTNTRFIAREKLIDVLKEEGFETSIAPLSKNGLFVLSHGDITKTNAYKDGLFTVQDQSSQLASEMLDPKPGDFVMDMCSAPGGKTTHLAELMQNEGKILAFDLYEKRLFDVLSLSKRLKVDIIKTKAHDATVEMEDFFDKADRVLVDVPCSGMGIIRRKPDIKYKEDLLLFEELTKIQKNILVTCSKYLKKDGIMIYSTCTINPAENMDVVSDFLKDHPNFCIAPPSEEDLTERAYATLKDGYGTFLPGESDGFFICRLRRIS